MTLAVELSLMAALAVLSVAALIAALAGWSAARRALDAVDALATRRETLTPMRASAASASGATATPVPSPDPGMRARPSTRVDAALPRTLISIPHLHAQKAGASASSHDVSNPHTEILAMADRGRTAEAIARDTGQPIGQVELILRLRRPQRASRRALPGSKP